jgi:protein-disulfide isomerase
VAVDVRTELVIARPRSVVAAYAADPDNATSWYENIKAVEWETEPPLAIGSRIKFVAEFLGRTLAYTYEVGELVPDERLVMSTAQGPFPMETTYTWEDVAGGATRMTLRNRGEPAGFKGLAAPLIARAMRRANEKDLRRLKQILEDDANPRQQEQKMEPLDDAIDHVRGPSASRLIVEYGDYECPYSRRAFRHIERVESRLEGGVRFAFRHFPLTEIHPHALAAAAAAEAAARQDRFWDMHELLFHRQRKLEDDDLRRYAQELELDLALFESDIAGPDVLARIRRDVDSGLATGEVQGTPTLFIDGVVYRGDYDADALMEVLAR